MIQEYENFLERSWCEDLILCFNANSDLHERVENVGLPTFTQLNITQHQIKYELQEKVMKRIVGLLDFTRSKYPYLPEVNGMEQFRIKQYEANTEDRFDWHVDVTDYESARRVLALQFYLNTIQEGGRTIFTIGQQERIISPEEGKALVFPPMWMFPHRGEPCISENKYILTTYLHYV